MQHRRIRRFQRDIRPAAHGNADIRRCQRRRVIDAVADLRDAKTLRLQFANNALLVLRQQFRRNLHAELPADDIRRVLVVASEHAGLDTCIELDDGPGLYAFQAFGLPSGLAAPDVPAAFVRAPAQNRHAITAPRVSMAGQAKNLHGGLLEFEPMLTRCPIPAWTKTGFHFELVAARFERRSYSNFEGINDASSYCENFPFFEGMFATVRMPIKSGNQIRFDVGHRSDSMTAYPVVDRPRCGAAHQRERGTIP